MPILDGFLALLRRTCRSISTEGGEIFAGILRKPRCPSPRDEIFPGLFIRELEPRRVLSASSIALQEIGRTLIINAGSQAVNAAEPSAVTHQGNAIQQPGTGLILNQSQAQHLTLDDLAPDDTLSVTGSAASGDFTITSSHGGSLSVAAPPGGLTIQAGPDSTVDLSGVMDLHGGNLTVSAGSIQVDGTLISHGGSIDLDAGPTGTLLVSGNIDVSNTASGHLGGTVELLGDRVGLTGQAQINASGDGGGGSVLIGGGYHGANPAILDASITYVGPEVHISADAVTQGNGGQVVAWSNESTSFLGNISASRRQTGRQRRLDRDLQQGLPGRGQRQRNRGRSARAGGNLAPRPGERDDCRGDYGRLVRWRRSQYLHTHGQQRHRERDNDRREFGCGHQRDDYHGHHGNPERQHHRFHGHCRRWRHFVSSDPDVASRRQHFRQQYNLRVRRRGPQRRTAGRR